MNVFWGFLTVDMAFKAVFNRASMGEVVAHSRYGASIFADFPMVPSPFSHSFLKTVRSIDSLEMEKAATFLGPVGA